MKEMDNQDRFVIPLEDENTVTSSRKYFDTATTYNAQPVIPLPGPGIVVPVRSGINTRLLALITAGALLCGVLGGWALGLYRARAAKAEESPGATGTPVANGESTLAPANAETNSETVATPETVVIKTNPDEKAERRPPVLKPAKKPTPAAEPDTTPQTAPEDKTSPNNGLTRPRRAGANNERITGAHTREESDSGYQRNGQN